MLTILLVEDNPAYRSALKRLLERRGHRVREAETGTEAVARLNEERVCALVLDQDLPDTTGVTLFQQVRQSGSLVPDRPVFFLTSSPTPALEYTAGKLGACAVLSKSMPGEEICQLIEDAVRRSC
jgi:CheY-like chemotaxis protein